MIGGMDRRVTFYNPETTKEPTGGNVKTWLQWGSAWCGWKQDSGSKSDAGSQPNLFTQGSIQVRYSRQMAGKLSKDTVAIIRGEQYRVTDFTGDVRQALMDIRLSGKQSSIIIKPTDIIVQGIVYTVTAEEAGGTVFTVPTLIGKTVVGVATGRAIPCEVITAGTPSVVQLKCNKADGKCTVSSDAVLVQGEQFGFFYQ